jgi:hypothetical protein
MADIRLQHLIDKMKKLFTANIFAARYIHFMHARIYQSFYLP